MLDDLSDDELEAALKAAVAAEREALGKAMDLLIRFDDKKVWEKRKHASLYRYCIDVLGFSPAQAFKRMQAVRVIRSRPEALDMLKSGEASLGMLVLLSPCVGLPHLRDLLLRSRRMTRAQVEAMVADLLSRPLPEREVVRVAAAKLPSPPAALLDFPAAAGLSSSAAPSPARSADPTASSVPAGSLSPGPAAVFPELRVRLGLTVSKKAYDALQRIKGLLWHKKPSSRLEDALEEAAEFYLQKKDPARKAARRKATRRGRAPVHALIESRRIPQWVKDEVWARDGGRCACLTADGRRCPETTGLEYDHIVPWALGGRSQDPKNIRLACRAHNQQLARQAFGRLAEKRRGGRADGQGAAGATARRSSSRGG